jgi:hypothetical protein
LKIAVIAIDSTQRGDIRPALFFVTESSLHRKRPHH